MATGKINTTSDKQINVECRFCLRRKRIKEATKYCVHCKYFYCTPCSGMHKKLRSLKDHKLLDEVDFRSLGLDALTHRMRSKKNSNLEVKIRKDQHDATYQKDRLYRVKQRGDIDVKLDDDASPCNIWGSCVTEDGYLLLTDLKNKKLKRFDMSTETVQDYLKFPASPFDVCLISKVEAAVALHNNTVQLVSICKRLAVTRTLTMNHGCYGLAHKNDKLFVSDSKKNVYIHDMNGIQLQTISTDSFGQEIFYESRHITVSPAGDRVFVADSIKGLVILDHQISDNSD